MPDEPSPAKPPPAPSHQFEANRLRLLIDLDEAQPLSWSPEEALLSSWVCKALSVSSQDGLQEQNVELSLTAKTSDAMRKLNAQYRNADKPTNVLSFPSDMPVMPGDNPADSGIAFLGDVVLCPEVLEAEAAEQGKSLEHHWAHMVVHSVLHLNGLDHENESSAEAMESLEIQILSEIGINNPYLAASAKQS